ncbi:MAG: DUF2490 domain-containing protein [Saprospiraceae bacterium]|nr:DUF2490 domain-containing protein [Saprospiraceae bacterium]
MKHQTLLFLAVVFCSSNILAQAPTQSNYNNWFTYFGTYKLSPRWGMHFDAQFRTDDKVARANQSLLRAGVHFYAKPALLATLGYAYVTTYSPNAFDYFTEHRVWQQLLYNQPIGQATMTHRFRLEQRFVENLAPESDDYRKGHRFRYFNRVVLPLGKKQLPRAAPYLALQNEVFLNFASADINSNVFDQNRLLIALGIFNEKQTRLELGYMNHHINPAPGNKVTRHILHFSLLQWLNFESN